MNVHRRSWSAALEKGTSSNARSLMNPKKRRSSAISRRPSVRISSLSRSKYFKVVGIVSAAVVLLQLWRFGRASVSIGTQPSRTPNPVAVPKIVVRNVDTNNAISSISERSIEPWEITAEELPMQVISPAYSIRVLRGILNHSNHTYQDMDHEAHGYLIQTFLWMHVLHGLRPEKTDDFVTAQCRFAYPGNASRILRMPAVVHTYGLHPGDRYTEDNFPFTVECELPPILQSSPHDIAQIGLDIAFEGGTLTTPVYTGEGHPVNVVAVKRNLRVDITPPMRPKTEFAVCLSPIQFDPDTITLWRLLEWRQHMLNIGVERVNWYIRDDDFRAVLEAMRAHWNTRDIIRHAPILKLKSEDPPDNPFDHYSDQDVWYMECMYNNVYSSDWVFIIDTDEFLMPDFRLENPMDQVRDFLRQQDGHIGEVIVDRMEMIHSHDKGQNYELDLQQATFDCATNGDMFRNIKRDGHEAKTLYRSHAVAAFNQHRQRKMYPLPEELSVKYKKGKNQRWWFHEQRTHEKDVWPKLLHYRWYGIGLVDKCDLPSPIHNQPRYVEYLNQMRANVSSLAADISQRFNISDAPPPEAGKPRNLPFP